MDNLGKNPGFQGRRKSDLTLLGESTQEMEDRVYTLTFKVDLSNASFDGLHNYAVSIACQNRKTGITDTLSAVLVMRFQQKFYSISIEGGPAERFPVSKETLDMDNTKLDPGIIDAVSRGIAWVRGESKDADTMVNRRRIPVAMLDDKIAVYLMMSSISTLIAGARNCHTQVIKEKHPLFISREDYVKAMFDRLKGELNRLTEVAINRCVSYYMSL